MRLLKIRDNFLQSLHARKPQTPSVPVFPSSLAPLIPPCLHHWQLALIMAVKNGAVTPATPPLPASIPSAWLCTFSLLVQGLPLTPSLCFLSAFFPFFLVVLLFSVFSSLTKSKQLHLRGGIWVQQKLENGKEKKKLANFSVGGDRWGSPWGTSAHLFHRWSPTLKHNWPSKEQTCSITALCYGIYGTLHACVMIPACDRAHGLGRCFSIHFPAFVLPE